SHAFSPRAARRSSLRRPPPRYRWSRAAARGLTGRGGGAVMDAIGASVRRELGRLGPPGRIQDAVRVWPEAVGPQIARNAWPSRIGRDGPLHVAVGSSAWAFELSQLAPTISERLARLLEEPPAALRFAPGPLPEARPEPTAEPRGGGVQPGEKER